MNELNNNELSIISFLQSIYSTTTEKRAYCCFTENRNSLYLFQLSDRFYLVIYFYSPEHSLFDSAVIYHPVLVSLWTDSGIRDGAEDFVFRATD